MENHMDYVYLAFRFAMGINLLMHGVTRLLGNYRGFTDWLVKEYSATILPRPLVEMFGYALSPIEALLGLMLVLGLFTIPSVTAAIFLMSVLIFGRCLTQDWATVGTILIYCIYLFMLAVYSGHNTLSLDTLLFNRS